MLFGSKSEFGIEVQEPNSNYSKVVLWLGGQMVGSNQEEEDLKHICSQLRRIIDRFHKSILIGDLLKELNINYLIENESNFESQMILSLGTSFDDFLIRVVKSAESVYFFWKLDEAPYYQYKENQIGVEYSKEISLKLFEEIVKKDFCPNCGYTE